MPKKALKRKVARKASSRPSHSSKSSESFLQKFTQKKYLPFHTAGVGVIMVWLGVFATVGILLILGAAGYYIWKSATAHRH